jgi:acyl carrier protein
MSDTMEDLVTRLLLEHAQNVPAQRPFPADLSIRKDLAVESLSLVSVTLALGDELSIDVTEANLDFGGIQTVGDLVSVARALAQGSPAPQISAAG